MKALAFIFLLITLTTRYAAGQSFSLDWFALDGGGGASSSGPYTLVASIGQAATGTLTGGAFVLQAGFWAVSAESPLPAAVPSLTVWSSSLHTVTISWPYPSTGFRLEELGSLGSSNWSGVSATPLQVGELWQVTLALQGGSQFFRLAFP